MRPTKKSYNNNRMVKKKELEEKLRSHKPTKGSMLKKTLPGKCSGRGY